MKHLATIQSEFLKQARKWDEMSYDEQKEYLLKHRKTKQRLTAKPTTLESWASGRKFMNLETKQLSPFEQLPQSQQDSIRKQFEHEQATYKFVPSEKVERRKKFSIEGHTIRAKDAKEAVAKYMVEHEQYNLEQAKDLVDKQEAKTEGDTTTIGNYKAKEISKPRAVRAITDRRIKRLSRRLNRKLNREGRLNDEAIRQAAKDLIDQNQPIKDYFKSKGVEDDKMLDSFVEIINANKPRVKELNERRVRRIGRKIRRSLKGKKINDELAYKLAKKAITQMPAIKDYFKAKGVKEELIVPTFAGYIYKTETSTASIGKKIIFGGKQFKQTDDGSLKTTIGTEKDYADVYITFTDSKTNMQIPLSQVRKGSHYSAEVNATDHNLSDATAQKVRYKMDVIAKEVEELVGVKAQVGDIT